MITYIMQTFVPDLVALQAIADDIEGASPYIALAIGGIVFQTIFLAGATISVLFSGLASQLSASRLLYAMGRDGILARKLFGYVHPRLGTPVFNIVLIAVIGLVALGLDLNAATSLINFGAFTAFAFVNLSVIALWLRHRRTGHVAGSTLAWTLVPAIGFLINAALWVSLDQLAMTVGLLWAAVGVLYLLWITRMFRRPTPDLAFDEAEELPTGMVRTENVS
ncbi:APC family permease [Gulosibacter chungangensis]|uniref:APC family permease n=1 Tax=Gulosibacter chungangensis TaxID=979746 RepID=UPI0017886F8E|nr:amino acid permease [Gulosibacter chungangensis]